MWHVLRRYIEKPIDHAIAGEAFDHNLMGELEHLANRGYTEGFYRRHVPHDLQNYDKGFSTNPNQQFVGEAIAPMKVLLK